MCVSTVFCDFNMWSTSLYACTFTSYAQTFCAHGDVSWYSYVYVQY